ncbi:Desmocollin-2 [Merluccius polli]|uniref:Desmocollin-2 n=1 Tax=Merluccius polli TaxID=89951 RepID=A0AA47M286_MERPO|nr:Desmocollin-2 [Merluccius polli]
MSVTDSEREMLSSAECVCGEELLQSGPGRSWKYRPFGDPPELTDGPRSPWSWSTMAPGGGLLLCLVAAVSQHRQIPVVSTGPVGPDPGGPDPHRVLCRDGMRVDVLARPAQSCTPHSIRARVPVKIDPGYVISQGFCAAPHAAIMSFPLDRCEDVVGLRLSSSDPHFTVNADGTIVVDVVSMVTKTRSFGVWVNTGRGPPRRVDVQLIPDSEQLQQYSLHAQSAPWNQVHRRFKRRWSPLPFNIIENDLPPFPKEVELIGSDSSVNFSVYYTIHGPGVSEPPMKLFSVVRDTGMVTVNGPVDREQYPKLVFEARVMDVVTGRQTDRPLDITVLVVDVNDNPPTFSGSMNFHIEEQSSPDREVGVVTATDRDQQGTLHTMIKFTLLTGNQLFNIHPKTGMITTKSGTLDREVQTTIPVVVEIRDMNGERTGLFNTATATIRLVDINDNPPTFTQTVLKARVEENRADVLVLRIPVEDRDEVNTTNWKAKFVVVQGNENNNFRVDTDPKTNEGLLYVVKPLDHEKGKVVELVVSAQNEAPLVKTSTSWNTIPVELSVGDVDEGPEFFPLNKVIKVRENTPNGTVLGSYQALDPETKSNAGIRYYKMSDPGHWLSVGETTGELKVTNTIDLESPLVTNAMYNITVKAVDLSSKSGMGMVTLVIEDANDNVPELVDKVLVLCEIEEQKGSVTVTAHDADILPYSSPFNFQLAEEAQRKWRLRDAQNTSVVLEQAVDMVRGEYKVPLRITDLQDKGGVQVVTVRVCRCLGGQCVATRSSVSVGAWGVLAVLLAVAMLLMLCLLFVFVCNSMGEKKYMDESGGGMLLQSNTEAPGEEVKSSDLLMLPTLGGMDTKDSGGMGLLDQNENMSHLTMGGRRDFMTSVQHQNSFYSSGGGHYQGGANYSDLLYQKQANLSMLNTWETNKLYLEEKLDYFGGGLDVCHGHDLTHAYQYEGEGSAAGSVGCCSGIDDSDGLEFLETLGPKFKTLASICLNKQDSE